MKKRILGILLVLCMFTAVMSQTVSASDFCVFSLLRGSSEVVGLSINGYTMGDELNVATLTLQHYPKDSSGIKNYGIVEGVKYWVDGQSVEGNYNCTTPGEKKITLKKGDMVAEASFQVKPKINGNKISEMTLVTPPSKTTFYSNIEEFKADDIVVKCTFTDEAPEQIFGYQELELYVVERDKPVHSFSAVKKQATAVTHGYVFKEPGEKDLIIRIVDKSIRVPITVVSPTSNASKTQMASDNVKLDYVVGEGFKMSEFIVRCSYEDGSYEDFSDDKLSITVNGNKMSEGYKFTTAGDKKLVVKFGDFKQQYTLNVKAKTEVVKTPKVWCYRVGEGFRMSEFTVRCNYEGGNYKDFSGGELSITANGNKMYEGYKFQQAGNKNLVVKYGDYSKKYTLTVVDANSPIMEMIKEPLTFNYRVGEGFRMSDYVVRCNYPDGTTKDFTGSDLTITANGVTLSEGYEFKQAGSKKLIVKYGDFKQQYTLKVKNAGEADEISVTVDGNVVKFDQQPVIKDDRTLVPLRAIFTELGASVDWNEDTETVTAKKDNTVVTMQIGNTNYKVNNTEKTLDVPAQLINSRTLIPVRAVAESFDCDVSWNEDIRVVEIIRNDASSVNNPFAELARDVLYYTNVEREKQGLDALTWDDDVAKVAQAYSENMATNYFLAHEGTDGSTPVSRIKDAGISYKALGENVGMGTETAKDIVKEWMNSEGHKANILNPDYTHLGVGVSRGDNGYLFWTQNFLAY